MSIKKTLEEIIKQEDAWVNPTDKISELITMLRKKEDKIIDRGKLTSLFTATKNRANYSYYYTFTIAKINELFPDRKTQISTLYTNKEHFLYMKFVLADALESSIYKGKTFNNIIESIKNKEDPTGISELVMDPKGFLNGSLDAPPPNYSLSWDRLLDLLAGKDVSISSKAEAVEAEAEIKDRLSKSKSEAAGDSAKSIDDFFVAATDDQKKVFKENLEQSLLMEIASWCSNFREVLRWFELYDIQNAGPTFVQAYKNLFQGGKEKGLARDNHLLGHHKRNPAPYGGRLCPITFEGSKIPVNNLKTHPFSWMFFRDIDDLSKVQTKIAFYKMIYRTDASGATSQYEAPLPITLPEELDPDTTYEEAYLTRKKCKDDAPFGDEKNVRLESINISFKGTTPTTAQNDVDVTITFHIPRIATLNKTFFGTITTDKEDIFYEWKILDFITYYGNSDLRSEFDLGFLEDIKYSGINSRLIMKVGYMDEFMASNVILQDLLANSPMILDLSVIDHSIAKDPIKPEAKVTVKYAGFISKMFNSPMTDVLAGEKIESRVERQKIINFAQDTGCDPKIVEELMTASRAINKQEAENLRQNLIGTLYDRARIFSTPFFPNTIKFNSSVIGDRISFGYDFANAFEASWQGEQWDYVVGKGKQEPGEVNEIYTALSTGDNKRMHVYWTTIGDIIDAAMDTIYKSDGNLALDDIADGFGGTFPHPAKKLRTNGEFISSTDQHRDFYKLNPLKVITTEIGNINIADFPVSINFLRNWITTEIVDQGFDFYPLVGFIKQLIQACVTNFLNEGKSNMERPTIVAVDADLSLPINPSIIINQEATVGARTTTSSGISGTVVRGSRTISPKTKDLIKTFITYNATFWDKSWAPKLSGANTFWKKSQNAFQSAHVLMKNQIINKKYNAACKINEALDFKIYKKYAEDTLRYSTPIFTKRFEYPRELYYSVIYCYAYPSRSGDYLPLLKSESDCIANGIPVIRLPDFKYKKRAMQSKPQQIQSADEYYSKQYSNATELNAFYLREFGTKNPTAEQLEKYYYSLIGEMEEGDEGVITDLNRIGMEASPQGCQVVKSIKFTKKDDDYLREARYSSQHFGLFSQLTSVYSATVELNVLCTFLTPGMFVYIDGDTGDTIFDPNSMAATLGLGGVHIITSVQHKTVFEENVLKGFTTTFDALYVYNGNQIKQSAPEDTATAIAAEDAKRKLCNSLFDKLVETETSPTINQFEELITSEFSKKLIDVKEENKKKEKVYYNKENIKNNFLKLIKQKNPTIGQAEIVGDLDANWSMDAAKKDNKLKMYVIKVTSEIENDVDGPIETELETPKYYDVTYVCVVTKTTAPEEAESGGE